MNELKVNESRPEPARRLRLPETLVVAITAAMLLAIYLLRLDQVVGQFEDDAWYLILAKSLATGHGYNLINLPQHSGFYFYPPFFPFLLSLVYRISPDFPRNVFLLKSVSVISMLVLPFLVFRFFHRADRLPKSLAYLLAFATAAAPSFVMLATSSLMSECIFTTLQMATLLAAERSLHKRHLNSAWGFALLTGVRASFAYLTRAIGITLIAAVGLHFLRQKMLRHCVAFSLAVGLCVSPWLVYKHLRAQDTLQTKAIPGYSSQIWDRLASARVKVGARDLPARFWQTSTTIAGAGVGGILVPSFYRSASESGEELVDMTTFIAGVAPNAIGAPEGTMGMSRATQLISLFLTALVVTGLVVAARRGIGPMELVFVLSLTTIIIWPWPPIRFLVPLLPFVLYYLLLGVAKLYTSVSRRGTSDPWAASRIVLICILALFLYDNGMYMVARHENPAADQHPDWLRRFNATQESAKWIRDHTSANEATTGDNLPMLYLYAGRDTEMCDFDECVEKGIRYYLKSQDKPLPIPATLVFRSSYHGIEVLDIKTKK